MAKYNNDTEATTAINLIGTGTEITGDINSNGDVRIDGALKGNLKLRVKWLLVKLEKLMAKSIVKTQKCWAKCTEKLKWVSYFLLKLQPKYLEILLQKNLL